MADKEARCVKNLLVSGQQAGAEAVGEAKVAPWMLTKEVAKLELVKEAEVHLLVEVQEEENLSENHQSQSWIRAL